MKTIAIALAALWASTATEAQDAPNDPVCAHHGDPAMDSMSIRPPIPR